MDWVNQPCNNTRVPPEHSLFPLQHWPETQGMAGVFQMPAAIGFRSGANPRCAKLQEEKKVFLTQLCSPHASGLPSAGSLQHLQDRHILTLIIWDRSPASASSRTMLSSLSSMKESKYLIMLGWFSCCRGRECKSSSYSVVRAAPAAPVSHSGAPTAWAHCSRQTLAETASPTDSTLEGSWAKSNSSQTGWNSLF